MEHRPFAIGSAITALITLHLAFLVSTSAAHAVEVDGIAATVGTESILRSDVLAELARRGRPDGQGYSAVLKELIDRKLILKAARESKMTMQEWIVENRVREIVKKSFGGDRNKLIETLGRQKMSYPEWYAKTKDDLVIGAMRWNVIDKNVTASPAAMRKEYEAHGSRYAKDHTVSVSVISLTPDEQSRRDEISKEIREKSFDELGGKKYENVKPEDVFRPEICAEIEKMPKGTISHWIELDGWSYLLRKDGEEIGQPKSFDEAYDEIEAAVKEQEARRLYTAWMERLCAETYIRVF